MSIRKLTSIGLAMLGLLVPMTSVFTLSTISTPAYAEEGVKLILTDGTMKKDKNGKPIKTTNPAEVYNAVTTFKSKNGSPNIFVIAVYKGKDTYFRFEIKDKDGKIVDNGDGKMDTVRKVAVRMFILNNPGTYTMSAYQGSGEGSDKPVATATFTVVGS